MTNCELYHIIDGMNLPQPFVDRCNAAYTREIPFVAWVRETEAYLTSIVKWFLAKYSAYPCGLDETDLLSIFHADSARRLGLWNGGKDLTWDPNHERVRPLAEYVYVSGTRAVSNSIKRSLKVHAVATQRSEYPVVLSPNAYLSGVPDAMAHPMILDWERDDCDAWYRGGDMALPSDWPDRLDDCLFADDPDMGARDHELDALHATMAVLADGGRLDDALVQCALEPERFGEMSPERLDNLYSYVSSKRWDRNRGRRVPASNRLEGMELVKSPSSG